MMSVTFQKAVLTAQKVLIVDESQSLTQQSRHNKHHCQTNKFVFSVCLQLLCTYAVLVVLTAYTQLGCYLYPRYYTTLSSKFFPRSIQLCPHSDWSFRPNELLCHCTVVLHRKNAECHCLTRNFLPIRNQSCLPARQLTPASSKCRHL